MGNDKGGDVGLFGRGKERDTDRTGLAESGVERAFDPGASHMACPYCKVDVERVGIR